MLTTIVAWSSTLTTDISGMSNVTTVPRNPSVTPGTIQIRDSTINTSKAPTTTNQTPSQTTTAKSDCSRNITVRTRPGEQRAEVKIDAHHVLILQAGDHIYREQRGDDIVCVVLISVRSG